MKKLLLLLAFLFIQSAYAWKPEIGAVPSQPSNLEYLDGSAFDLESLRGRPAVVYFGADWCPPCVEHGRPAAERVAKKYAAQGVRVIFVAMDDNKFRPAKVREAKALGMRIVMSKMDMCPPGKCPSGTRELGEFGRVYSLPTAFVLDAEGILRSKLLSGRGILEGLDSAVGDLAKQFPVSASPVVPDEEKPLERLQIAFYVKTNDRSKQDIELYLAAKSPKALAINPNGQTYWWGPVSLQLEGSRRALEDCELAYKSPCVLAAIDNVIQKHDPATLPKSAFADLGTELDPGKVPFLSDAARISLKASYLKAQNLAPQYVALALHPRNGWYLKADPSFTSQAEANQAALSACVKVAPPNRYWNRGSCLLFSEGSRIVANLPQSVTFASSAMVKAAEGGQ